MLSDYCSEPFPEELSIPFPTAAEELEEYTQDNPQIGKALANINNVSAIYGQVVFSDDTEERRKIAEGFLEGVYLLNRATEENKDIKLFICKNCGTVFLTTGSDFCSECNTQEIKEEYRKKRKAALRRQRESTAVFKAQRAAEKRVENQNKDINAFRVECDNKRQTLTEAQYISWLSKQSRQREPKKQQKINTPKGTK